MEDYIMSSLDLLKQSLPLGSCCLEPGHSMDGSATGGTGAATATAPRAWWVFLITRTEKWHYIMRKEMVQSQRRLIGIERSECFMAASRFLHIPTQYRLAGSCCMLYLGMSFQKPQHGEERDIEVHLSFCSFSSRNGYGTNSLRNGESALVQLLTVIHLVVFHSIRRLASSHGC